MSEGNKPEKNVYERLLEVQHELVAPREIAGKFGKARSAEQILEAAKPVCYRHGLYLYTTDKVEQIGERNYVTSTAYVINTAKPEERHEASASAWENEVERNKYGAAILDTSQVTGKTSSYAKKYALQNLLAIDDTKDADSDEHTAQRRTEAPKTPSRPAVGSAAEKVFPGSVELMTDIQRTQIKSFLIALGYRDTADQKQYLFDTFGVTPDKITKAKAVEILESLK